MTTPAPSPAYPRLVLAGCMTLSLAGNLMHAHSAYNGAVWMWFAVAWAGIPPVAVPVLIELVGREARRGGATAAFKWAVGLAVTLTVIAFLIPYTDPNLLNASEENIAIAPFTLVFSDAGIAVAVPTTNAASG